MTLKEEIAAAYVRSEEVLAAQVNAVIPAAEELDETTIALLQPFIQFCSAAGVRSCPARPHAVCAWILSEAKRGTPADRILATLSAIEEWHDRSGFANPVTTSVTGFALDQVIKTEPPRSWTRLEQGMFRHLPPEIRAAISRREHEREKTMRRSQNEAADLRHKLKQVADNKEPVNETTKEESDYGKIKGRRRLSQ